jgi:hypothetical protein
LLYPASEEAFDRKVSPVIEAGAKALSRLHEEINK